ncbi:LytTR family DNA-binding domain-containing protein [Echinicola jeungdonensis]|uniref:LytR/AlgR family response regulator transcription factor n=2 Tax=Echinicola jeungdonensis TaxID=709343 RepID=A0ABV5J0C3_9BACT|nr:LytTR family DNA-binding domain-containing protein [Echinicola jeungdonensis]MDN3671194.1 LytTR family DNA-binding domain-containing protein [Echinicola jeungdonensis]
MKINCIAVDDEPLALEMISKFIGQTSFLNLMGKFENAIDALAFIHKEPVDLVFLDIQMPDLSGMELARIMGANKKDSPCRIIFTTAYNQFAIEGYKVDALDYLLKPYNYEEFLKASTKALQFFENQKKSIKKVDEVPEYIFLKVEYQLVKVLLKDILYVEAYKDYVKVHLVDKPHPLLSLTSLKNMEELLPSNKFMRVHRSFIVALDHIHSITKNSIQIGKSTITVSENYKENFLKFLNRWMG